MPFLNPKEISVTRSRSSVSPPYAWVTRDASWCTFSDDVSITRSAAARRVASVSRSRVCRRVGGHHPAAGAAAARIPAGGRSRRRMLQVQDLGQRARSGEVLNIADSCSKKNSVYAHPEPRQVGSGRLHLPACRPPAHARRQVVDDIPAEVLQRVGGCRPTGAGHAGHDDQPELGGRWLNLSGLSHGDDYPLLGF